MDKNILWLLLLDNASHNVYSPGKSAGPITVGNRFSRKRAKEI
jgi:hypothetical protein